MFMRKLILMVGLVFVGIACGDAVSEMLDAGVPDAGAETPGDGTSMQYVGNSTQTFRGSQYERDEDGQRIWENQDYVPTGNFPLYAACQETFGPGHRICTSAEIQFTTKIPNIEGRAWYGIGSNCPSGSGTSRSAVTDTGGFKAVPCSHNADPQVDTELPVACCGPK